MKIFFLEALLFIVPTIGFAQSGIAITSGSAQNIHSYIGQPFFSQYGNSTGAVSESVAQAYLIRNNIEDDMCQYDIYENYGFSVPVQNSVHTLDSMHYNFNARFNYDSVTTLVLSVRPVYHLHDTLLYYADDLHGFNLGKDTVHEYTTQYGCDSITYLMVYSVDCPSDTIITAPYGESAIAVIPNSPIVSPSPNIVSVQSDAPALFPVGETTPIHWDLSIAGKTLACLQDVEISLPPCGGTYTITDVEQNEYSTVRIGFDCWTKENIKSSVYSSDSSAIPVALVYQSGMFNNYSSNLETFGRLYSWYSAVNVPENSNTLPIVDSQGYIQGICPNGWHLPTEDKLEDLISYTAPELKSDTLWILPGNNATDFSALPSGMYNAITDQYINLLGDTYFWSCSTPSMIQAICAHLSYSCDELLIMGTDKRNAQSVRCLKN